MEVCVSCDILLYDLVYGFEDFSIIYDDSRYSELFEGRLIEPRLYSVHTSEYTDIPVSTRYYILDCFIDEGQVMHIGMISIDHVSVEMHSIACHEYDTCTHLRELQVFSAYRSYCLSQAICRFCEIADRYTIEEDMWKVIIRRSSRVFLRLIE